MFAAVLLVGRASHARVAGMTLLERAAFTMARAGARRLVCIGEPPASAPRLPALPVRWIAFAPELSAADTPDGSATAIVMDAAAVVDPETIAALAAVPFDGTLRAAAPVPLWRCPLAALPDVLARSHTQERGLWRPPPGSLLLRVEDDASQRAAESALFVRTGRASDGWLTRHVDRRLSRALTRLLLPTGITPNHITLASIALGLAAGPLLAAGDQATAIAGSLLFLLSTIVDGCDGEMARLTFRESRFGAYLDLVGDNVVHLCLFAGIAIGVQRRVPGDWTMTVLGVLLVAGVLVAMATAYWSLVHRSPTPRQRALFEAFASREFGYLLVALALVDALDWFLGLAAFGTYAFSAALLWLGSERAAPH